MKRILVLSDSHRDVETMIDVVKKENPNMIIHLETVGMMLWLCRSIL